MSAIESDMGQGLEAPLEAPLIGGARTRAGATIGVHSVCDFFSFMAVSLLPLLGTRLQLENSQIAMLLGLGSITSGVIQPMVAWASDKLDTRWLGSIGLLVAVVCVSLIGRARTFEQLMILQGLGAAGIGAFHPPAAACVGQLSGKKRSLGVALFFLAGMLGGVAGNVFTPRIVDVFAEAKPIEHVVGVPALAWARIAWLEPDVAYGLRSLTWMIIPGAIAVLILGWAIHKVPHRHHEAHENHNNLTRAQKRARWGAVWILYATNLLRFSANMALIYLFAEWAERHVLNRNNASEMTDALGLEASALNGPLQGMMQIGMGGGGILLGIFLGVRHEKLAFIGFPLLGALVVALVPIAGGIEGSGTALVFALAVLSGVGFGSVIPVSMSLAQRLLPHRTSMASGLMLGGAWAFAFIGPKWAQVVQDEHSLDMAFYVTSGSLAIASGCAMLLPGKLLRSTSAH